MRGIILCDICIFVLCLIVVPLPQGKNPFAVQLNSNNNNNNDVLRPIQKWTHHNKWIGLEFNMFFGQSQ
jgi:hypothetical protein